VNTGSDEVGLQRVAFVAMPFGRKATDLRGRPGPQSVDFDALWTSAIAPALNDLGYLAVRADNQIGAVIVKDMLEQLVHADLVLADVSLPNGNVYYEVGVRHAARAKGCVLLRADWSRPLFDLAQITQLRYPFPDTEPTESDYQVIRQQLASRIPALTVSTGPVWELTQISSPAARRSSKGLREVDSALFDFSARLLAASLKAASQHKAELRTLLAEEVVQRLPDYALRDVVKAAGDHLTGIEVLALIERLPPAKQRDPFILEHKAFALSRTGALIDAIALQKTLIDRHEPTPARLVTLGELYAQLAMDSRGPARRRNRARALSAFRSGMSLDLNDYRPSTKLLAELLRGGEDADEDEQEEARQCAAVLRAAVDRALQAASAQDLDLDAARIMLSIHARDATGMRRRVDAILDRGEPGWRLVWLVRAIDVALAWIPEARRGKFDEQREKLAEALPVPQAKLVSALMPQIREHGRTYRKTLGIEARPARPGEVVVSITSDGEETSNVASDGDMLVRALTEAAEQYLVGADEFARLYEKEADVDDGFARYRPRGRVRAIEITRDVTDALSVADEFFLIAPWRSQQFAREGDLLVAPLPALEKIYRIARKEFEETYTLEDDGG
jgi:tRNA threonylcarbamoyladenosine modification (KEOPS) complex  Pcc1 subunit